MIAKVIAWGRDRSEARARVSRALRQTTTVISGGTTNKAFLPDLLDRPEFVARRDRHDLAQDPMMADGYAPPRRVDVALLATAFEAYEAHARRQRDSAVHLPPSAVGPRSDAGDPAPGRRPRGRGGLPAPG